MLTEEEGEQMTQRGLVTLIWGVMMGVMLVAFGVKAVDATTPPVTIAETPVTEAAQDMPEIQAQVRAEAFLAERRVNVPDNILFECEAAGACFGVCPEVLEAIAWKESRFQTDAKRGSCIGIMQMNQHHHGDRLDCYGSDRYDVHSQIWAAASLLHDLSIDLGREGEPADAGAIIAAYHGENNPYKETPSNYTETVLRVSAALERAHGK